MIVNTSTKRIYSKTLMTHIDEIVGKSLAYFSLRLPIVQPYIQAALWEDITTQLETLIGKKVDRLYVDIRRHDSQNFTLTVSYLQSHCLAESKLIYDVKVNY